jgi:hypothetical protein
MASTTSTVASDPPGLVALGPRGNKGLLLFPKLRCKVDDGLKEGDPLSFFVEAEEKLLATRFQNKAASLPLPGVCLHRASILQIA